MLNSNFPSNNSTWKAFSNSLIKHLSLHFDFLVLLLI